MKKIGVPQWFFLHAVNVEKSLILSEKFLLHRHDEHVKGLLTCIASSKR